MNIQGIGLDRNGRPIFAAMDQKIFLQSIVDGLSENADAVRRLAKATSESVAFRGEVVRSIVDAADPKTAGWTILINTTDPRRKEIEAALAPLASHRGMGLPLLFQGGLPESWFDWLQDKYYALALEGKKVPHYVLIAGGPDQVPFRFQSILDTVANVGRIDFDKIEEFRTYVEKIIRLETAPAPSSERDVVFFAPDAGKADPTYFSREYMAKPLAEHVQGELGFLARTLFGKAATKKKLLEALKGRNPALVYTASHGLGLVSEPLEVQKRYNGGICCQAEAQFSIEDVFSAEDVPVNQPFLEGAVFFQFACFGYGTPAESDFAHWLPDMPKRYAPVDFVAELPKRLLAHPRGPIAFIGHLDTAFLHAFADPNEALTMDPWHSRIEPFLAAVDGLLAVQPSGLAMEDMAGRYGICNALLTNTYDRGQRGALIWTEALRQRFLDTWIIRSDAQNYMLFGDPAARLRLPSE